MTISHWIHVDTYASLAIIVAMLVTAVVVSLRRKPSAGPEPVQDVDVNSDAR